MTEFEHVLVKSFNNYFKENDINAIAYRLIRHRFTYQKIDILVDSADPDYYLGIECKSMSIEKGEHPLYFKNGFTIDRKGRHQVERISEFLRKSGRKGFLAVELRNGIGFDRLAYLIPWRKVENEYRKGIKITIRQMKRYKELKRRGYTSNSDNLYEPLKRRFN